MFHSPDEPSTTWVLQERQQEEFQLSHADAGGRQPQAQGAKKKPV